MTWFTDPVSVKLLCGADLLESFAVPKLWKDEDVSAWSIMKYCSESGMAELDTCRSMCLMKVGSGGTSCGHKNADPV